MNVIICGAGIAGLSAAHELMKKGYSVVVIESLPIPGGLARSEVRAEDNNIPSEYSWRGFGPWYHNTYDIMKQIPTENKQSIYDCLSRPIRFHLASDEESKITTARSINNPFQTDLNDKLMISFLFTKYWTSSNIRAENVYSKQLASNVINSSLSVRAAHNVNQVFGPWVGVDSSRASVFNVSKFFKANIMPGSPAPYYHKEFTQGAGSGWLILNKPSNQAWFDPWVKYLKSMGVTFIFNAEVKKINRDKLETSNKVSSVEFLTNGIIKTLKADYFISALNPFAMAKIIRSSQLQFDPQLAKFDKLIADGPHIQISFRIAFKDPIKLFPRIKEQNIGETAIVLTDSEYDITLFSQNQLWSKDVNLGHNVKALWSGTACLDCNPGKLYNLPMKYVTKQQFIDEIKYQIYKCRTLNDIVKLSNDGKDLSSFEVSTIEVWYGWTFPEKEGTGRLVKGNQPKWVNTTNTFDYQPECKTSISNLFLAGAHVKTNVNLYSMEGAVESGKRAADHITGNNTVVIASTNILIDMLQTIDAALYKMGLPEVIYFVFIVPIVILVLLILLAMLKS